MAVDLKRLAAAAADAAFTEERAEAPAVRVDPHRRGALGGLKGLAAGAAIVAAARVAAKHAPRPLSLAEHFVKPDLSDLGDRLRDRLDDWFGEEDEWGDESAEYDEDEPEDEAEVDEDDDETFEDEEPAAEADDDEPEEPDDEAEEDEVDEDDLEDEEEPEAADDDELEDEDDEVEEDEDDDEEVAGGRFDPASRPPKPPKRRKAKAG